MKSRMTILVNILALALLQGLPAAGMAQEVEPAKDSLLLDLRTCREKAREGNADIRNAYLDIEAARQQKMEAFTMYFPSMSVRSMGFYALDPFVEIGMRDILGNSDLANNIMNQINQITRPQGINLGYEGMDWGFIAVASVIQPVFAGGRIVNGNRLAQIGVKAAELKTSMTETAQTEEIDKKYWQLISLKEKSRSLDAGEELAETLYTTVDAARRAGLALDTDLMKVMKEQNILKSKRKRLESGMRLAKMDLLNSIGQPFSLLETNATEERPFIDRIDVQADLDHLEGPESYYAEDFVASSNSTEARLLELSVEAARLEKKMEIGSTLPEVGVGLAGGYGRMMSRNPRWNGLVMAKITIPITDWWRSSHKIRRLQIKEEQARNQKVYLDNQLELKAQMLWEEVLCTWEEFGLAEENVEWSETAYERSGSTLASGQATVGEYLQAATELQLARDELTDKKIAYITALTKYINMTGKPEKVSE